MPFDSLGIYPIEEPTGEDMNRNVLDDLLLWLEWLSQSKTPPAHILGAMTRLQQHGKPQPLPVDPVKRYRALLTVWQGCEERPASPALGAMFEGETWDGSSWVHVMDKPEPPKGIMNSHPL